MSDSFCSTAKSLSGAHSGQMLENLRSTHRRRIGPQMSAWRRESLVVWPGDTVFPGSLTLRRLSVLIRNPDRQFPDCPSTDWDVHIMHNGPSVNVGRLKLPNASDHIFVTPLRVTRYFQSGQFPSEVSDLHEACPCSSFSRLSAMMSTSPALVRLNRFSRCIPPCTLECCCYRWKLLQVRVWKE